MGSGQSARRLTISNEEEIGVIKVSNAIVQRLAQRDGSGAGESFTGTRADLPNKHPAPPSAVPTAANNATAGQPTPGQQQPELTMSALQIQQQMEEELKKQDQFWQRRLQNLEDGYQQINSILEEEYKKAITEIAAAKAEERSVDVPTTVQLCLEDSNKVIKCFQEHPKETLKCSNLVEEFANCLIVHHTRVIESRS
ncbi:MICOS complex subunit Mic19 [Cataglyphis hispanica]|uniref:MICOS complex subunit Mic19 n=1 Tax=Cataglyphis hispanica TaxID=1086592 RepID=UPI0021806720|nr:MICOS complex subunit Mic19 [Cataglyphis hispanica]XP_050447172.1 MICOS complex subunit Mic19 [Cataglyphis hispanica]